MGKTSMQDKKKKLQSMGNEFKNSLEQIYTTTLQTKNYIGSDIWGFFSNKTIDKYCIREGARNILVILTDGFVYDARNIQENVKGDSCSYITPKTLGTKHLWVTRQGLDSLEVLLLELNPYTPTQQTPLCEELTQWFEGMGVKKLIMACTDMPVNTQHIIDDFIK